MENQLYKELASRIQARHNCQKSNNTEWFGKHTDVANAMLRELPHGSGIDGEWRLDFDKSNGEKVILYGEYHAMDDNGYYDGWIDFRVTITPSLQFDFNLSITGNFGKYQDVKDYLYDILRTALEETVDAAKITVINVPA